MRWTPLTVLTLLLVLTAAGCSNSAPEDGRSANNDDPSAAAAGGNDAIDERYISNEDQGPTLAAIQAGLNPNYDLVPDEFLCHDEDDNAFDVPDFRFTVDVNGNYASNQGSGRIESDPEETPPTNELVFVGGPLDEEKIYLHFDNHGQRFSIDLGRIDLQCYQHGASEARALTQFELNTPNAGDYTCRDVNSGQSAILNLSADRRQYTIGGQSGIYKLSDVIDDESARLEFESGPFADDGAWYSEEPESGYQSFNVSTINSYGIIPTGSSSELALICERFGSPIVFAQYGRYDAPVLAGGPLAGLYARDDSSYVTNSSYLNTLYYRFNTDGYVFVGTPHPAGTDCRRTHPNGLPYCYAYQLEGGELRLFSQLGQEDAESITLDGTRVAALGEDTLEPVTPVAPEALVGVAWRNFSYYQSGCTGGDFCSSSLTQRAIGFEADGRFVRNSSSQSTSSSTLGDVSAYAAGSSNASILGNFDVQGNWMQLRYDNGRVTVQFVSVSDQLGLSIDELQYYNDPDPED